MNIVGLLGNIKAENGVAKYSETMIMKAMEIELQGGIWITEDNSATLIAEHSKELQYDGRCDERALEVTAEDLMKAMEVKQYVISLTDEEVINELPRLEVYTDNTPNTVRRILSNDGYIVRTEDSFVVYNHQGAVAIKVDLEELMILQMRA